MFFSQLFMLMLNVFPLLSLAQTPACLLAAVNQANDPSNLALACNSDIGAQIANVCHGKDMAAASSAFSVFCAAALTSATSSSATTASQGASLITQPTSLSSAPFTITASTPVSTGGFTTQAGTPTYAPVGPVAFNTQQAPSTSSASYIYQPTGPAASPLASSSNPPAGTPLGGAPYISSAGCVVVHSSWVALLLMITFHFF